MDGSIHEEIYTKISMFFLHTNFPLYDIHVHVHVPLVLCACVHVRAHYLAMLVYVLVYNYVVFQECITRKSV